MRDIDMSTAAYDRVRLIIEVGLNKEVLRYKDGSGADQEQTPVVRYIPFAL